MKEKFPISYGTDFTLFQEKFFPRPPSRKKGREGGEKGSTFFMAIDQKASPLLSRKNARCRQDSESLGLHTFQLFSFPLSMTKKSGKKRTFPIFPDSASHRKKGPINAKVTLQKITLFFSTCSSDSIRLFF